MKYVRSDLFVRDCDRKSIRFGDHDSCLFRNVESVEELSDILVLYGRRLLNSRRRLGHEFNIVAIDVQLVLLRLRDFDGDTRGHGNLSQKLLTQKVAHFEQSATLHHGAVDGEMRVGSTELVAESERNTLKRGDLRVRQVGPTYPHLTWPSLTFDMLEMCEQTVRTAALSLEEPIHFSTRMERGPVDFISTLIIVIDTLIKRTYLFYFFFVLF